MLKTSRGERESSWHDINGQKTSAPLDQQDHRACPGGWIRLSSDQMRGIASHTTVLVIVVCRAGELAI